MPEWLWGYRPVRYVPLISTSVSSFTRPQHALGYAEPQSDRTLYPSLFLRFCHFLPTWLDSLSSYSPRSHSRSHIARSHSTLLPSLSTGARYTRALSTCHRGCWLASSRRSTRTTHLLRASSAATRDVYSLHVDAQGVQTTASRTTGKAERRLDVL